MRPTIVTLILTLVLKSGVAAQVQQHKALDSTMQAIELRHVILLRADMPYAGTRLTMDYDNHPDSPRSYIRSETNALAMSVTGTALPIVAGLAINDVDGNAPIGTGIILGGLLLGPSLGYFEGKEPVRGLKGIAIRSGIALVTAGACGIVWKEADVQTFDAVAGAGVGAIGIHAVYDIVKVKSTVRRHNYEMMMRRQLATRITPVYFADSGAAGMQLLVDF